MKLKMRHFPGKTLATAGIVATALAGIINPAAAVAAPPQAGEGVLTHHSYYSENLGSESGIMVYTPPQYDGRKPLPVLYLAPGACRDEYEWLTRTPGVNVETLDAVFESGEATPMIIVSLNSRVGSNIQGNPLQDPFPKELVETVVPFVDSHYKTIPSAQHRALAGHSCGGVQTLNTLLQYPGAFSEIGLWDTGWFAPIRASFSTDPALAAALADPHLAHGTKYLEARIGGADTVAGPVLPPTIDFLADAGLKADSYTVYPGITHSYEESRLALFGGLVSFFQKP